MKTSSTFKRLYVGLLMLCLPLFLHAQSVIVGGRCFDPPTTLAFQGTDIYGKNIYSANGTYQGVSNSLLGIVWDESTQLWYLYSDGGTIFQASSNTGAPPGTSAWSPFSGGPDNSCTDPTPLSVTGDGVLPVELLSFVAKINAQKAIQLLWQVGEEQRLAGYEIWKSSDAKNWRKIGFVKAQNQQKYEYIDASAYTEITYYQLRSINLDASFSISATVSVSNTNKKIANNPMYYPNPTSGKLNLPLSAAVLQTSVLDLTGKVVLQSNNSNELDISGLPNGTYILKIQSKGKIWQQKVTKI